MILKAIVYGDLIAYSQATYDTLHSASQAVPAGFRHVHRRPQ